jgi:hypothetical protein
MASASHRSEEIPVAEHSLQPELSRRGVALGLALLALLLAVVAVASRRPLGAAGPGPGSLQQPFYAVLLVAGAAALVLLVLLAWLLGGGVRRRGREAEWAPAAPKRPLWPVVPVLVALGLWGLFIADLVRSARRRSIAPPPVPLDGRRVPEALGGHAANGFHLAAGTIAAGGGMLVVLMLTLVALVWRPHLGGRDDEAPTAEPLGRAVESSLRDLETAGDPRQAVIRAYLRMQAALAGGAGGPRGRAEAPREYLRRLRDALPDTAAAEAGALTALFEEARFSRHVIAERMRREALHRLVRIRALLGGEDGRAEL